jgi:hypothetical protein
MIKEARQQFWVKQNDAQRVDISVVSQETSSYSLSCGGVKTVDKLSRRVSAMCEVI